MAMPKGKVLINVNDIIGKRLGKLEVTGYHSRAYDITNDGYKMRHYYWVRCDCGAIKVLQRGQLTSEIVHSCGCLKRGRKGKRYETN